MITYLRTLALAAAVCCGFFAPANAQTYPGIFTCSAHQWMSSIGIGNNPACSQPAAADLSNGLTGTGAVVLQTSPTILSAALTGTSDVQQALKTSGTITPTALGADVNDYSPTGLTTSTSIRQDGGAANRNITGLAAQTGGTEVSIFNIGATNNLVLKTQSASSSAANRFALGNDITLTPGQSATLWYDSAASRWIAKSSYTTAGGVAGTVTQVNATYPICGGPITGNGTLTYCGPTFSGRLTVTSTTALKFSPFNGDLIRISGVVFAIPSAGIAGCGNTGVFVNGVASQNLVASTSYNIYAFSNSGTLTCDFRGAGGHATSATAGNVGTEILSGDDSRSLIGLVATDAAIHFIDGQTASWFNQRPKSAGSSSTTTGTSTADTFVTWGSTAITISSSGILNNTTTQAQSCQLLLDGSVFGTGTGNTISGSINNYPYGLNFTSMTQSEGSHTVATKAIASTGTTTCTYNQSAAFSG